MAEDAIRAIVERHFRIYDEQDEKVGGEMAARLFYIMTEPSEFDVRYEQVRSELRALDEELICFIRRQGGEDILFVTERPMLSPRDGRIAGILLLLTVVTTTLQGAFYWHTYQNPGPDWAVLDLIQPSNLLWGFIMFSLPLMAILGVHESAHFMAARRHGLRPTLPYFIPLPPIIFLFGTLGAFIRLRDPLPDRRSLFDVGASGPIAGFLVAIPLLLVGTVLTDAGAVEVPDIDRPIFEADGFLVDETGRGSIGFSMDPAVAGTHTWSVMAPDDDWRYTVHVTVTTSDGTIKDSMDGTLQGNQSHLRTITVPEDAERVEATLEWDDQIGTFGEPLLVQGMRQVIPASGEYLTHPLFFAAWVGIFVTGLNLLPIGQLDGGHVARAVFGERARFVATATLFGLLWLSFQFPMWAFLAVFVLFTGMQHPPPLNDRTQLDAKRVVAAVLTLVVLVVTFIPVPLVP